MEGVPSTGTQLMLAIGFLLPGAVYQFVLEARIGRTRHQLTWPERIARAIVMSLALGVAYVLVGGPLLTRRYEAGLAGALEHPRVTAAIVGVAVLVVPTVTALIEATIRERRQAGRYSEVPTSWDFAFNEHAHVYVRARLHSGTWVGGWYGSQSYASTFPEPESIFLERAYRLDKGGNFIEPIPCSRGIHLLRTDIDIFELHESSPDEPE